MQVTINIDIPLTNVASPSAPVVKIGVGFYQGDNEVKWAKPDVVYPVTPVVIDLDPGVYVWKARALDANDNQVGATFTGESFDVPVQRPVPSGGTVVIG